LFRMAVRMLLLREARQRRAKLLHFFEALSAYIQCGYDLSYAWYSHLEPILDLELDLKSDQKDRARDRELARDLEELANQYPDPSHRLWFALLARLYSEGAPLEDAVLAAVQALQREHLVDLESHCRTLPYRLNLRILLFFLPPTFLLLFFPLLG